MTFQFDGKRVGIVGMARSGMAAAAVLSRRGADVVLYDGRDKDQLKEQIAWAKDSGAEYFTSAEQVGSLDIAVVSPGIRLDSPFIQSIRNQNIELWGEVEAAYAIAEAPILAVTGTNGKTTTALLLAEMVRAGGVETYAAGNIAAGSLAQPLIAASDIASKDAIIVAEISSFQLETIRTFRPLVAAILNITPDHQDRQSWDEYVYSKWRIFENQSGTDTAVLSAAVPRPPVSPPLPPNTIYFDKEPMPDWIDHIRLPGFHNRLNVLAASIMARAAGVPDLAIREAAESFNGVVHRLEFVAEIDGVVYINNSMCTNNSAYVSSLAAIDGRKVVISGGVYKGGDMSPIAEAVAKSNVKNLITFGRSGPQIAEIVSGRSNVAVTNVADLDAALSAAVSVAASGDTVILNPGCASFDQFKDFEDRGDQFKDLVNSLRKVAAK